MLNLLMGSLNAEPDPSVESLTKCTGCSACGEGSQGHRIPQDLEKFRIVHNGDHAPHQVTRSMGAQSAKSALLLRSERASSSQETASPGNPQDRGRGA